MTGSRSLSSFSLCVVVFGTGPLRAQGVPAAPLAVHTIWGSREFASDLVELSWMKDGKAYTTVDEDASGNTDLYRVDAVTGAKQLLVRGADLVPAGGGHPVTIEEYRFSGDRWSNRRQAAGEALRLLVEAVRTLGSAGSVKTA